MKWDVLLKKSSHGRPKQSKPCFVPRAPAGKLALSCLVSSEIIARASQNFPAASCALYGGLSVVGLILASSSCSAPPPNWRRLELAVSSTDNFLLDSPSLRPLSCFYFCFLRLLPSIVCFAWYACLTSVIVNTYLSTVDVTDRQKGKPDPRKNVVPDTNYCYWSRDRSWWTLLSHL